MAKTFILAPTQKIAFQYAEAIKHKMPNVAKALVMVPEIANNPDQLIRILQVSRKSTVHIVDAPDYAIKFPEKNQVYMQVYNFARTHNPHRIVKYRHDV